MKECIERLQLALTQDSKIACSKAEAGNHPGNAEQYLDELGLERKHLKRLERLGMAVRGYVNTKQGWIKRWLLFTDTPVMPRKYKR